MPAVMRTSAAGRRPTDWLERRSARIGIIELGDLGRLRATEFAEPAVRHARTIVDSRNAVKGRRTPGVDRI